MPLVDVSRNSYGKYIIESDECFLNSETDLILQDRFSAVQSRPAETASNPNKRANSDPYAEWRPVICSKSYLASVPRGHERRERLQALQAIRPDELSRINFKHDSSPATFWATAMAILGLEPSHDFYTMTINAPEAEHRSIINHLNMVSMVDELHAVWVSVPEGKYQAHLHLTTNDQVALDIIADCEGRKGKRRACEPDNTRAHIRGLPGNLCYLGANIAACGGRLGCSRSVKRLRRMIRQTGELIDAPARQDTQEGPLDPHSLLPHSAGQTALSDDPTASSAPAEESDLLQRRLAPLDEEDQAANLRVRHGDDRIDPPDEGKHHGSKSRNAEHYQGTEVGGAQGLRQSPRPTTR